MKQGNEVKFNGNVYFWKTGQGNHSEKKMTFEQNKSAVNGQAMGMSVGKACHTKGPARQWLWGMHVSGPFEQLGEQHNRWGVRNIVTVRN